MIESGLGELYEFWGIVVSTLLLGIGRLHGQKSSGNGEADEDALLVERAREGDQYAFDRLIHKYQSRIYQFCYRMLSDPDEAEELTQDVFVKLYRNLKRFRYESKFSTWLFQIAKNLTLNKLKYLKRRHFFANQSLDEPRRTGDGEIRFEVADETCDLEAAYENLELQQLVQTKIAQLRPEHRVALVLRDMEGLRYDEIARILNLAEGTVKSRIHRARLELRDSLEGHI